MCIGWVLSVARGRGLGVFLPARDVSVRNFGGTTVSLMPSHAYKGGVASPEVPGRDGWAAPGHPLPEVTR